MEEYNSAVKTETSFTTEEVETLIEVGALLSSNLRLEEVVEILMEQAVLLVKAATGVLWLKRGEEAAIVPVASYGLDYDAVTLLDRQLQDYVNGLAAAGKPVITGNGKQDGHILERTAYAINFDVTGMVFLPLVNKGRLLGCLQLINKQDGSPFSRRDIRLCHTFASQAAVIIDNSLLLANQEKLMISLIRALTSALDARDPYTRGHSERVSRLSLLIAREIGLSPQQQEILQQAALLHDVGKIGIRDNVLLEPGPLDEDKWRIMKSHPVIGAQIIEQIEPKSVMKQIYEGVMYHQEKYDGSGYPGGLRGKQIPLVARIIAIADAYDAITSDRPYRKGKSPAEALAEIKNCAGKHFDPHLVEVFLNAMQRISTPADG
ncbi:HD-GYP domain-containing protein [Desulfotomaculum varum]